MSSNVRIIPPEVTVMSADPNVEARRLLELAVTALLDGPYVGLAHQIEIFLAGRD